MTRISNIELLNDLRAVKTSKFYGRIPQVTIDNLAVVAQTVMEYEPTRHELTGELLSKIGKQIVAEKGSLEDKLTRFDRGQLPFGATVEEVYIDLIPAESFNDLTAPSTLLQNKPAVIKTAYHSINRADVYTVTISEVRLRQALTSEYGIYDMLENSIKQAVFRSDDLDDYLIKKNALLMAINEGITSNKVTVVEVDETIDTWTGDLAVTLKTLSKKLTFSNYSTILGVESSTNVSDQIIITTPEVEAMLDVFTHAGAFQKEKTDTPVELTVIDDFRSKADGGSVGLDLSNVLAIVGSDKLVNHWYTIDEMRDFENGKGLTTNYFKHSQGIYSYSKFVPFAIVVKKPVTPEV